MGRKAFPTLAVAVCSLALTACGSADRTTTITGGDPGDGAARADPAEEPAGRAGDRLGGGRAVLGPAGRRALERHAESAAGEIGIVVSPLGEGRPVAVGDARGGLAWSTMKVPLIVALLDRVGGIGELSDPERDQVAAALTASDNEAALALFERLQALEGGLVPASRAIEGTLRRSGDGETKVNTEPSPEGFSTFGQTIWSGADAARFFRALAGECLLGTEDTDFLLSLMEQVVAEQRWGLGAAPTPGGALVAFKGGWGPEPDGGYLVRQAGVVRKGGRGYVVSVIAIPDETGASSFAAGQGLVSDAASVVAEEAGAGPRSAVTCEW